MTASLASSSQPAPVAFGRSCGWYHAGSTRHGVLLCAPVGFEGLCIRQSWNILGDLLAQRGLHVLRFDYPGEGDAPDREAGEALIEAAEASIGAAADWLVDQCRLETLSVVGLRLGAALAVKALAHRPLHRLALLAPVLSGRAYLREQKMTAQVLSELRPGQDAGPGEINICGFLSGAADNAAISAMTLPQRVSARHILLALEPDRAAPDGFAGAEITTFSGYGAMMTPPTESVTPFADFNRLADWLALDVPKGAGPGRDIPREGVVRGRDFRETHLRFGRNRQLVGVLCEPTGPNHGPCVHLLNAGANYHIGWARMSVDQARMLAREGIASFRYDFSGIGDSVWYPEGPRPHIYHARHIDDAEEAIAGMAERGYHDHVLAGLCAGGYVAFQAAGRNPRVCGAVAANAIRLVWHETDDLDALATEMIQPSAVYREKLRSGTQWRRLLSGDISLARLASVAATYGRKGLHRALQKFGLEPSLSEDTKAVRSVLQEASRRGARVSFLHAERDQSRDETERHFGPGGHFARQQPGVIIEDIAGADHELTPRAARQRYLELIRDLTK